MKPSLLLFTIIFMSFGAFAQPQLPTNGLVAWYPFCGNPNDYSGHGHDLINNNAILATDRFGNSNAAYDFNGTSGYLYNDTVFAFTSDFTFSFWMKPAIASYDAVLVFNGNTNANGLGVIFGSGQGNPSGRNVFALAGGIGTFIFDTVSINQWHHIAFRKSSGVYAIYIDTVNVGSSTHSFNTPVGKFAIGNDYTNFTNSFKGKIDDVAIYDRALSDTEIKALYTLGTMFVSSNSPLCVGDTLKLFANFSNSSSVNYNWLGPNSFTSASQYPVILNATAANAGTYYLTDTVYQYGCSTVNVTVNSVPSHSAGSNSPVCVGKTLAFSNTATNVNSYHWAGPGSFSPTTQNPQISNVTLPNAGTYYVIDSFSNGCEVTDTVHVTVNTIPTHSASGNSPVCTGDTIKLFSTSTSVSAYHWTGPNAFVSTIQNPQRLNVVAADGGTYTVVDTFTNGCYAQDTIHVTINTSIVPTVSITSTPAVVIAGQSALYQATVSNCNGTPTYQWKKNGVNLASISNIYNGVTAVGDHISVVIHCNAPCTFPDSATSNQITTSPAGIHILSGNINELSVFPNPGNGSFTIHGQVSNCKKVSIEILNSIGQLVYHDLADVQNDELHKHISFNKAVPGNYLIRISTTEESSTIRFTIE